MAHGTDLTLDTRLAAACALLSSQADGETMLLSIGSGAYYGLEGTAGRVWQLLQEPRKIRRICEVLVAEYEVAPQICRIQVSNFCRALLAEGLVRIIRAEMDRELA